MVIGLPLPGAVPHTCSGCAQIYWTYETGTASGTVGVTLTVKQGTNVILTASNPNIGSISANQVGAVNVTGATFTGAVKGAATMTAKTTVGTASVTQTARLNLQ
jgi:hypothetical protein